jgi:hypothetical protein
MGEADDEDPLEPGDTPEFYQDQMGEGQTGEG